MQMCYGLNKILGLLNEQNKNNISAFVNNSTIAIRCTNVKQLRHIMGYCNKSMISGTIAAHLLNHGYVNINCKGHPVSNLDINATIVPYKNVIFDLN